MITRRDLRFAARSLARTPVLTAAALLSMAVGIAAAAAVFSVVDAALLRPPPFPGADHLAILYTTRQRDDSPAGKERWSWPRFKLLETSTSFEAVASFTPAVLALTGDQSEPANAELVSSAYWRVLRITPTIGAGFPPDADAAAGVAPVAVLSDALWRRRFAGSPSAIGSRVAVNGVFLTIVGVAPAGFDGLTGRAQLWIPATMAPRLTYPDYLITNQSFISVVGRLRDGVSLEAARQELALLGAEIQRRSPLPTSIASTRFAATATPLAEARVDPSTRQPMLLLLGAAVCLLLLACFNVGGLLIGRALTRRREIAIRVATGASPRRIVVDQLTESGLLAVVGGAFGVALASVLVGRLVLPASAPRGRNFYGAIGEFATPRIDWRVLAFCIGLCALATLVAGLLPALRAARVDLVNDLRDGGRGASGRSLSRQFLVGIETAIATALLFAGGLLALSWNRLENTDVGFDRSHLLTFWIRPSEVRYPAAKAPALIDRVLDEIRALPDVEAATVDGCAPVGTGCANSTLYVMGRPTPKPNEAPLVLRHYVAPDHFRTLGVPLLRGRVFEPTDRAGSPRVAVISLNAARRFWPGEDPIGQRVWFGGGSSFDSPDSSAEIVGIVGDVANQPLTDHPFQPDFYTPYKQFTFSSRAVLVRTRGAPTAAVEPIRRALARVDPELTLFDVHALDEQIHLSWGRLGYQIRLFGSFAVAALLLAATGLFAVIAHSVSDRRSELGVRMALGASTMNVVAVVSRQGAVPALIGLGVGLSIALATGHWLAAFVYGVAAVEPALVGVVFGVTALVSFGTTSLAARRALAIQPSEAMRGS
ncbi:MAG TPA: ADOP family duplicated permease [Gemmatimonadaceae bacterium]